MCKLKKGFVFGSQILMCICECEKKKESVFSYIFLWKCLCVGILSKFDLLEVWNCDGRVDAVGVHFTVADGISKHNLQNLRSSGCSW